MRVGIDILSEVPGLSSATETYIIGFLRALWELNIGRANKFILFANKGNVVWYRRHFPEFSFVELPGSSRPRWFRVLIQQLFIPILARRYKLDVVSFPGTTGAAVLPCASVQHVRTLHHYLTPGSLDISTRLFRIIMMSYSAKRADLILTESVSTQRDIERFMNVRNDKIVIVPAAVDKNLFRPINGSSDPYRNTLRRFMIDWPYILFVAKLWPYKNAGRLIQAYKRLIDNSWAEYRLVIAGGDWQGELLRLENLASNLGIGNKVHFLGHIPDRKVVRDLYVGASVFVYPSYCETFGLPVLEAMACGTPVVASNRTSIPEVVGDAGLLVDPDSADEMADRIGRVIDERDTRTSLIEKGFRRAAEFTWERTAREAMQAWKLAVERRAGRA